MPEGSARMRRARAWLATAFLVHCTLIGYVGLSVGGGSIRPPAAAVAAVVLAAAPLAMLVWWERREPTAARPARWMRRAVGIVPAHAVGVGLAAADRLGPAGSTAWGAVALVAVVVTVVELLIVRAAGRCALRPLSADLGELDVEIQVKIRPAAQWIPSWLSHHDVRVTDELLIVTVRPGPRWGYALYVPLADIRAVGVRPSDGRDVPWFTSPENGVALSAPPGDVVVIHDRNGVRLLPVEQPAGFAEVLDARVARGANRQF